MLVPFGSVSFTTASFFSRQRSRPMVGFSSASLTWPIAQTLSLDFLCQEMNREVNTIGSKATDTEITRTVIDMKSGIEAVREQVQNLE